MNFAEITLERLIEEAKHIKIEKNNLYLKSYPFLIQFFAEKQEFTTPKIVQGIHMVYAWMPTTLKKLDIEIIESLLDDLFEVKKGKLLRDEQLELLKNAINNSVVGTSKLLHFINPNLYPIWDSKIVKYITGNATGYGVDKVDNYLEYVKRLIDLTKEHDFIQFKHAVKKIIGYDVSDVRTVEIIMFLA